MAVTRDPLAAGYRAAVSCHSANRGRSGGTCWLPADETAGQAVGGSAVQAVGGTAVQPVGGTAGFLRGDWNVVRRICDHRTGQVGWFRGQASFRSGEAGLSQGGEPGGEAGSAGPVGRVLAYDEHGELRFGGHRGPASRSLLYLERADGSADVRFADGREFYRLDLRSGTWQAEHPCRADRYLVTTTVPAADRFTERWRVTGPAKDYELTTTYTRAGGQER
jgi:hypothetical protein